MTLKEKRTFVVELNKTLPKIGKLKVKHSQHFFHEEIRTQIKEQDKNLSNEEVLKRLGELWRNLPPNGKVTYEK